MLLEDFANYFRITPEIRSFILKYKFAELSGSLENVPLSLEKEFILERGSAYRQTGVLIIVIQDNHVFLRVIVEVKSDIIRNTFPGQPDAIGTDFNGIRFGDAELDGEG